MIEQPQPEFRSPGEKAVDAGKAMRHVGKYSLCWVMARVNEAFQYWEEQGISVWDENALIGEALARIEIRLPAYLCPLCGDNPKHPPFCRCGGRGWFAKCHTETYAAAKLDADKKKCGLPRSPGAIVRHLVKLFR